MNARVPPVPSRTNASTINTGIFISTSLTVVPDTVQVNRWASHCQPTLFKLTLTGSGPSLGAIVEVSRHSLIHAGSAKKVSHTFSRDPSLDNRGAFSRYNFSARPRHSVRP
jgi:hypothetical protein